MYVCLWSPVWSTDAAPAAEAGPRPADAGPHLAALAPRIRVDREVVWADGRGLDAAALATRLLDRLAELGIAARAGVAPVPITARLAARWGGRAEEEREKPTPFLVKERTGWGWRHPGNSPALTPSLPVPARDREGPAGKLRPESGGTDETGSPARGAAGTAETGGLGEVAGRVIVVQTDEESEWQAPLPVSTLTDDARLLGLLDGVGVTTLGALAALDREAIEVRFGPDAVAIWRLARADDRRILFRPVPPDRPCGSIDFVDYVLTDPARLLFTANALLGPLCDRLADRGEHARALRLVLPLADGSEWDRVIRPARPTASRDTWLRLLRNLLERLSVPDAVAGMRLELGRTEPAAVRQGDLFDRGFATAAAVEAAVARLAERQVAPVAPRTDAHPLIERRTGWEVVPLERLATPGPVRGGAGRLPGSGQGGERAGVALQLLPEPRRLIVDAVPRRDHDTPVRLRDRGGWREIVNAAGPDRISGGQWEGEPYAREYFRCVTDEGVMLWVYRDAKEGGWWLHGWWD